MVGGFCVDAFSNGTAAAQDEDVVIGTFFELAEEAGSFIGWCVGHDTEHGDVDVASA